MFSFIITIHIIVSLFLIAVILLQAGRGGGLADAFGASQVESIFGTKTHTVLTRLTTICAVMFIFTCLTLALLSAHRSRSLIEKLPQIPPQAETQKISEQKVSEQDETRSQTQRDSETSGVEKISEEQQVQQTGDSQKEQQPNTESAPKAE